MPEFIIRHWAEQTLFACRDYRVDAPTLGDALRLLDGMVDRATDTGQPVECAEITGRETYRADEICELDPEEVVDGDTGYTLVDEDGKRLRDLISVPTGCVQLGEPMEMED